MLENLTTMPSAQRMEFLENNSHSITEGQYFRRFDEEDVRQHQSVFMDKSIELKRVLDEFEEIKSTYKKKIKALETDRGVLMQEMMQSGEWLDGKQYAFDDQENGKMEYYDENGNFISSRRLLPNERQLTITSKIAKTN